MKKVSLSGSLRENVGKKDAKKVRREGKTLTFQVVPRVFTFLHQPVGEIGAYPELPPVVGGVYSNSPAHSAGVKPGDRIISVDGHPATCWDEIQRQVAANPETGKHFVIERNGKRLELNLKPKWNKGAKRYLVGIAAQETVTIRYPFPRNFLKAWRVCLDQSTLAYRTIAKLVKRKIGLGALSGPVIKPIALADVLLASRALPKASIIGTGGVYSWKDAIDFIMAGASAVGLHSALYSKGIKVLDEIAEGIRRYMERRGYSELRELKGLAHKYI